MEEDTFKQPGFPMQEGTKEHEDATAATKYMEYIKMGADMLGSGGKKDEETPSPVEPDHKGDLSI